MTSRVTPCVICDSLMTVERRDADKGFAYWTEGGPIALDNAVPSKAPAISSFESRKRYVLISRDCDAIPRY